MLLWAEEPVAAPATAPWSQTLSHNGGPCADRTQFVISSFSAKNPDESKWPHLSQPWREGRCGPGDRAGGGRALCRGQARLMR